jgi:PHD/YefM family antitoxin component YafN of YafNO toxin-antitoxin module
MSKSVGMREFRANLQKYTRQSKNPLAITSHGQTVGYYIPAKPSPQEEDFEALKEAVRQISTILEEAGVDEDDILSDFKTLRHLKS